MNLKSGGNLPLFFVLSRNDQRSLTKYAYFLHLSFAEVFLGKVSSPSLKVKYNFFRTPTYRKTA